MDNVFSTLYGLISPLTDPIANFAKTGSDPFGEFYSKALIGIVIFLVLKFFINLAASKMSIDTTKNKVSINLLAVVIALISAFTIPRELLRTMFSIGGFTIVFMIFGIVAFGVYWFHTKISGAFGQNKIINFIFYVVFLLLIVFVKKPLMGAVPFLSESINMFFTALLPILSLLCLFSFVSVGADFFKGSNYASSIERKNSMGRWVKGKWRSLKDKVPEGFVKNIFSRVKGAKYDFDPKPVIVDIARGTNDIGRFFTGCDGLLKAGTPLDKIHLDTFEANYKTIETNLNKLKKETNLLEENERKGELLSRIDSYIAFFKDIKVREGIAKLRSSKKSKDASDKFYILDANTFIWVHNCQSIIIALKDHYSYFYNLYNKYNDYFPKESTFENELAVALNVKSIEEETEKLIVVLSASEKTYLKAKKLRQDAFDIYKGLESSHPDAFVSYSTKYSMHSHFLDDFLTWVGANGKDYLINENSVRIHENNVIRSGLHKYRHSLKRHLVSLKKSDKDKQFEQEIKFLENVGSYIDRLYFVLFDLLKLELDLVKGEELKKANYFESLQKIILQMTNEASLIDDKEFAEKLAPKMQELSRISGELNNLRESRLSVSYEFEYREEQRLLNELLTFLK